MNATNVRPGDLITVEAALQILPVGRTLIYELIAEGAIPSIRVVSAGSRRGRILVVRSGLDEFVSRLRAGTPPRTRTPIPVDVDALRARVLAG